MKYILLLIILAICIGCNTTKVSQPFIHLPETSNHNLTALGFHDNTDVSYFCFQSEVNPALVWDVCHFRNFSDQTKGMCIKVSYKHQDTIVATSRVFCSGPLTPGEFKDNYATFTPQTGRAQLDEACGSNMLGCQLIAEEVQR